MGHFDAFMKQAEELMVKLFNSYEILAKQKICYARDIPLLPSEVHAVHAIATDSSLKMGDLAEILGITKGAVSKMASKLEKKGLIRRYHYLDNRKDVYFQLTELGQAVLQGHEVYHQMREKRLYSSYKEITPEHAEIILSFLKVYHSEMALLLKDIQKKG